jgi:hypothetical protein
MSDKDIKPNEKEMRLFEQEKMELYKGTFVVCIVYGLSAFILLVIILFTDWGKVYIYDMFAPAVITYILGALIIIIYLLNEIFSIKPRKIGTDIDSDNNILCPDFWKLEKVPDGSTANPGIKEYIIKNNNLIPATPIIPEIINETDAKIQYRCVADPNVFGTNQEHYDMKNNIKTNATPYMVGFTDRAKAVKYDSNTIALNKNTETPDYIVAVPGASQNTQNTKDLKKYAKFSGAYSESNTDIFNPTSKTLKIASAGYLGGGTVGSPDATVYTKYESEAPLICNVVYPQVLGLLDSNTKEKNEVSCEYAKQCGISWSSLKCN